MAKKTDKVLRFVEMFENYDIFDNDILKPIQAMYPNAKWLDPNEVHTSFETLYKLFIAKHGNKFVRYDYAQAVGIFQLELVDKLPDLYVKQSIITDESLTKLADFAERGFNTIIEGNVGGTDSPNNSGKEIELKDGDNVTRKQATKQTSKTYNFVADIQKLLSTKVSTYMIDFLDIFNAPLFVNANMQIKLDSIQDSILLDSFFSKLNASLKAGAGISFVISQDDETIEIQNNIHPHITNGNTDPETESINLEDNDIGGTYNLKIIIDDLTAIRNQADAIGDHEFKDENNNLISFDDNSTPKQVYTTQAVDKLISNIALTPGPAGKDGEKGEKGDTGADSVVPGPAGKDGEKGEKGDTGADSTVPGPAGKDGADGQDGADSVVPGPPGPEGPGATWNTVDDLWTNIDKFKKYKGQEMRVFATIPGDPEPTIFIITNFAIDLFGGCGAIENNQLPFWIQEKDENKILLLMGGNTTFIDIDKIEVK